MLNLKLRDIGEKKLISDIIVPLINPTMELDLAGDDCAVIHINEKDCVSVSTDRVPVDLISFKLNLINYYELGYYLAILNISDVLASGSKPVGLFLNLAFDGDFIKDDFESIIKGAKEACDTYNCKILGGDLSSSKEMNLVATIVGQGTTSNMLYRRGCQTNDYVFASGYVGLTPTAFKYYMEAKVLGMQLSSEEERVLTSMFKYPKLQRKLSESLAELKLNYRLSCMDNTDGIYQTLHELANLNNKKIILEAEQLLIHPISYKVAEFMKMDILDLILSAGADFQLIGTFDSDITEVDLNRLLCNGLYPIGRIADQEDADTVVCNIGTEIRILKNDGWNYYPEFRKYDTLKI